MIFNSFQKGEIQIVKIIIVVLFFTLFQNNKTVAQNTYLPDSLVLINGQLLTSDSLNPVIDAHIISKEMVWGTISDTNGIFRLYVDNNDTLLISSLGFKIKLFVINDSLMMDDSLVPIIMDKDTITLNEVLIRAFWDYETFKQMIIDMRLPDNLNININDDNAILNRPLQPSIGGPVQALYNLFNHSAKLQRKLVRNRKKYNELMIQMGRINDTIPAIPEHMQGISHSP